MRCGKHLLYLHRELDSPFSNQYAMRQLEIRINASRLSGRPPMRHFFSIWRFGSRAWDEFSYVCVCACQYDYWCWFLSPRLFLTMGSVMIRERKKDDNEPKNGRKSFGLIWFLSSARDKKNSRSKETKDNGRLERMERFICPCVYQRPFGSEKLFFFVGDLCLAMIFRFLLLLFLLLLLLVIFLSSYFFPDPIFSWTVSDYLVNWRCQNERNEEAKEGRICLDCCVIKLLRKSFQK